MGIRRDLKNNVDLVQSLHPAARTASANGATVDLLGYDAAMVIFHVGAYTNGSFTLSVQESEDDSAWSAVSADDLEGSLTAVTGSGQQNAAQRVGYKGTKRYIRAVVTEGSSPAPDTGAVIGASVLRGYPHGAPLA